MYKEDPPESLEKYIKKKFKEFWVYEAWSQGYLCLRCSREGVPTFRALENAPDESRCMICGKDSLLHGPFLSDIQQKKRLLISRKMYDLLKDTGFDVSDFETPRRGPIQGVRPSYVVFDEILGTDI